MEGTTENWVLICSRNRMQRKLLCREKEAVTLGFEELYAVEIYSGRKKYSRKTLEEEEYQREETDRVIEGTMEGKISSKQRRFLVVATAEIFQ